MLAAGAQPQTVFCFVYQYRKYDEYGNGDIRRDIHLIEEYAADAAELVVEYDIPEVVILTVAAHAARHFKLVLVEGQLDYEERESGSYHVERRAAYGLICLQLYCGKGEQKREERARSRCDEHGEEKGHLTVIYKEGRFAQKRCAEGTDERAEHHNTVKGDVDYTAALGVHTRKRHDKKRNGVYQCFLKQEYHYSSSPSACASPSSFPSALSAEESFASEAERGACAFSAVRRARRSLMNFENPAK